MGGQNGGGIIEYIILKKVNVTWKPVYSCRNFHIERKKGRKKEYLY